MITLLLTLFICLFSYCPSVNRLEDHIENNITINEKAPVKNFGYYDEYGVQLYMFNSDFLSGDFIKNFVIGVAGEDGSIYSDFSFLSTASNLTLNLNCTAYIINCYNDYADRRDIFNTVTSLKLYKFSVSQHSIEGEPFLTSVYEFSIYHDNSLLYCTRYYVESPMYNDAAHELGGVCCMQTRIITDNISPYMTWWCYYENSLDGDNTPVIAYYYNNIIQQRITINNERYNTGYNIGRSTGYQEGYNQALIDTQAYDTTASTIFNGALEIGLLPVNFFLSIFNFEIFGLNVKSIVSALLTLGVVIIIVRFLFGGKDNDK